MHDSTLVLIILTSLITGAFFGALTEQTMIKNDIETFNAFRIKSIKYECKEIKQYDIFAR